MKKIVLALIISSVLLSAGCSSKQADTKIGSKQTAATTQASAPATSQGTSGTDSNITSTAQTDYSKYSGDWAMETNIKNDFIYGLTAAIKVDSSGNLTGTVSDCTENATHIANVDIKGKIADNKFTYNFDEDGWEHSGTIEMNFKDDKMIMTLKYSDKSSKNNTWGIGEGTFTLVNRKQAKLNKTLTDLKSGGLQVIDKQCFTVKLENFGTMKFISGLKREHSNDTAVFYLLDTNNNVVYSFPDFYGNSQGTFKTINAISFSDVNNDGLKDIIIVSNYSKNGSQITISSIYFQHGTSFANNKDFDTKLNKSSSNKDVNSIIKFAKSNL